VSSLGEEFPKEQARVRRLLRAYQAIGAAGTLGSILIEETLRRADQAAIQGDVVAMLRSYEELKGCTG
jgi:hypothetical protein